MELIISDFHTLQRSHSSSNNLFFISSLGMVYCSLCLGTIMIFFSGKGSTRNGVFSLLAGNETLRRGKSEGEGGKHGFWASWQVRMGMFWQVVDLKDKIYLGYHRIGRDSVSVNLKCGAKTPNHPSKRMIGNSSSAFCGRWLLSLPLLTQFLY